MFNYKQYAYNLKTQKESGGNYFSKTKLSSNKKTELIDSKILMLYSDDKLCLA